jgi:hypothetical protein
MWEMLQYLIVNIPQHDRIAWWKFLMIPKMFFLAFLQVPPDLFFLAAAPPLWPFFSLDLGQWKIRKLKTFAAAYDPFSGRQFQLQH